MGTSRRSLASALIFALIAYPALSPAQSVGNRGLFGTAPGTPGAVIGNSGVYGTSPGTPGAASSNIGTFGSSQLGVVAVPPAVTNTLTPIPIGSPTAPSSAGTGAPGTPTLGGANFAPTGGGSATYCGNGGSNMPCSYFVPPGPAAR